METCPNCGSDVRTTARFCTSCGFRIPERAAGSTSIDGAGSRNEARDLWGTPAESGAVPTEAAAVVSPEVQNDWVSQTASDAESAKESVAAYPAQSVSTVGSVAVATTDDGGVAPILATEESINDSAENRINIALFHVERLRQLVPDLSGWSEEQAASVNKAISLLEAGLKGREDQGYPYETLRVTIADAKKDPRDIDVMIALSDRASEIEDLLRAHDQYSAALREALFEIKPAAVNYVVKQAKPVKKAAARPRRKPAAKTTTTPAPAAKAE